MIENVVLGLMVAENCRTLGGEPAVSGGKAPSVNGDYYQMTIRPTVCVTRWWAGLDNVREQDSVRA